MMIKFNIISLIFSTCLYLSIVFECQSVGSRNKCPAIRLNNGKVRIRSSGRVARISCNAQFKLVQGRETTTCVRGEWDSETPICARAGCFIVDEITHGRLNVVDQGAKLEVTCDAGYTVDGPSFVYCNEDLEWNEELKGCKEHDQIYLSCDFESSDDRFCGWKNDIFNDVDWLADKMSFLLFTSRRHVRPGSSQYFTSNYISLDTGNFGSSATGRLLSPPILPSIGKHKCLIFSYKLMPGNSYGTPNLIVTFGGIPHWEASEGEGRVIIGLYQFNVTSKIMIEGKRCKAAIDNMVITDGNSCTQPPYEEELDSCHDNCGKISNGNGCSCDWECHDNNNCCQDIKTKCPYIKPLEEIYRLYFTTSTATPTKVTTSVKSNISNVTVSNMTFSSKISNESKTSSGMLWNIMVTTPIKEYNVTTNKITAITVTSPIPTSNSTFSAFPPTPPMTTTINPIKITATIPSTTISTEVPKIKVTLNSNSTLFLNGISNSTSTSSLKDYRTLSNTLANISTITTRATIKPLIVNATNTKIIYTPNVTTTFLLENTSTIKLISKPISTIKYLLGNITSTTPELFNISSSTIKPLLINTTSSITKFVHTPNATNTSLIKNTTIIATTSINISSTTTKSLIINTTFTTKLNNHFTFKSNKFNVSKNVEKLNTTFITKIHNTPNVVTTDSKPTINNSKSRVPNVVEYLNIPTVPNKKLVVFDILPNPDFNTTLNSKLSLNNSSFQNVTNESTNRTVLNFNKLWKNVKPTTIKLPHEKPELNYYLHSQHMDNVDDWLKEHVKQNENTKSYGFDTVTIFKYIAAIGVILITFKYTLSFVRWYYKKPNNDDEMDACFIEADKEGVYNMELTSNYAD